MKKYIKRIVIGITMIIGLIILVGAGFGIKYKHELDIMTPLKTQEVVQGIYAVRNEYVNFYVIKNDKGYILIDSGLSIKEAEEGLSELGINKDEITDVLLTHTDYDHTAAISLFKNAAVYISEQEEQMINGKTHRQMFANNKLDAAYKTLKDGEVIKISNREIEGILTPGHTPGSMSYLVDGKYLFTGDTLSLKDGKAKGFNTFFNMNSKLQEESIRKLAKRRAAEYIFTGHYGYTKEYEAVFKGWQ